MCRGICYYNGRARANERYDHCALSLSSDSVQFSSTKFNAALFSRVFSYLDKKNTSFIHATVNIASIHELIECYSLDVNVLR